jgi:hypothetical protein
MPELNVPSCPTHGTPPRSLHPHSFAGIVQAAEAIIETVSGVGTVSYSRCPYGYGYNFEGVVRVLEDLNTTISGISSGSNILAGSGIYIQPSGESVEVGVNAVGLAGADVTYSGAFVVVSGQVSTASAVVSGAVGGNGINVVTSGDSFVISTDLRGEGTVDLRYDAGTAVLSGILEAGSGIYLSNAGKKVNLDALGTGSVTVLYSGTTALISGTDTQGGGGGSGVSVIVSGEPGTDYSAGSLWFDTNEGRLFVYASGNGVASPDWYQTNSEAIAVKSEVPPSGTGLNAPPRDGSLWFNNLTGSLFVYDAVTSGWYESSSTRSFAYGPATPPPSTEGAGWYSTTDSALKVWDGTSWTSV